MSTSSVHVIGAGIVGLCTAYYLQRAGHAVTVVDRGKGGEGTSHGNAGMVVPSHIVPMAAPGVIRQGLRWMLDPSSPFYIRPRLDLALMQWLWQFQKSATAAHVERSMPVLYALNDRSKALYKELSEIPGFAFDFEEGGLLMLYKSEKQAREEAELAHRAEAVGMPVQILDRRGLAVLEPEMDLDVLGGVYFPADAHLYPSRFVGHLERHLRAAGVEFVQGAEISDFITEGDRVVALRTLAGDDIAVSEVVLTAGSWSAQLLRKIGVKLLLQDGKGYSITVQSPSLRPRIPTILTEAKVAITPMGPDLRIGGTLEISGLSPKLNRRRVQAIVDSVPRYYRNWSVPFDAETPVWSGYRPCSPDGLPYIGRTERYSNLAVGTGHGMMGLSLGPVTGLLLSELVSEQAPSLGLAPFWLGRF